MAFYDEVGYPDVPLFRRDIEPDDVRCGDFDVDKAILSYCIKSVIGDDLVKNNNS